MKHKAFCTILLGFMMGGPCLAQVLVEFEEEMDFDRPEAWGMKYFTAANLFTGMGAPRILAPGAIEVALEGASVPSLSAEERTIGFEGIKEEDINKTSVIGRPRVTVGLPGRYSLDVSYVPPIEMFGVTPHLFGVGIGRSFKDDKRWRFGGRLQAQYGTLEGDFTCSAEDAAAGADFKLNPWGCEEASTDTMTVSSAGLEFSMAHPPRDGGRLEPHLAVGAIYTDLKFQVDARYTGVIDRTRLVTDGWIHYAVAGVNARLGGRTSVVGEVLYAPLDVVGRAGRGEESADLLNVRAALRFALRKP